MKRDYPYRSAAEAHFDSRFFFPAWPRLSKTRGRPASTVQETRSRRARTTCGEQRSSDGDENTSRSFAIPIAERSDENGVPLFERRRTSSPDAVVTWPSVVPSIALQVASDAQVGGDSRPILPRQARLQLSGNSNAPNPPFLGIASRWLRRVESSSTANGRTVFVPTGPVPVETGLTTKRSATLEPPRRPPGFAARLSGRRSRGAAGGKRRKRPDSAT
jgi:hypothetical protein